MAKYVRARRDMRAVLTHPETGAQVVPSPDVPILATDPLVKRYPEFFVSDEDLAAELDQAAAAARPVEEATARPGEKRSTRRS